VVFLNCLIFLKRLALKQILEVFSQVSNLNEALVREQ